MAKQENQFSKYKWEELVKTYDIRILSKNGSVIFFLLGNRRYYYGIPSRQIRRKGDNLWTKGVMKMLRADFNNAIPLKGAFDGTEPIQFADFGKYSGLEWGEIKNKDPQYVEWVMLNFKNKKLLEYLKNLKSN